MQILFLSTLNFQVLAWGKTILQTFWMPLRKDMKKYQKFALNSCLCKLEFAALVRPESCLSRKGAYPACIMSIH